MLNTGKLAGKVLYISGASRGIGKAIALKAAKDGARIVVAAKTTEPHPKLPGTIFTAAEEIEAAGGKAFPCMVDIRNEEQIQKSIDDVVKQFGGIDIVVNNASAIDLTGTQETSMKKFDLMHQINTRGTYLVTKLALPYLKESKNNPHVLNISPPLNMNPRWFKDHVAYTMAKYGMSMCVLGMSEEFKQNHIAVNALWPKTAITTAAMEMLGGKDASSQCRTPEIMADAAYILLNRDAKSFTGNFAIDEEILKEEGVRNFSPYLAVPRTLEKDLIPDFFLDELPHPQQVSEGYKVHVLRGYVEEVDNVKKETKIGEEKTVQGVFDNMGAMLNEDLIQKVQAVYQFNVNGSDQGTWHVDLKNSPGSSGRGEPKAATDVTFSLTDADFHKMFEGELNPTKAFMSGKLKIGGNLSKAMALEKVMKNMSARGYHTLPRQRFSYTLGRNHDWMNLQYHNIVFSRKSSDVSPATFTSVSHVFERIKAVANADMVEKVKACYIFEVEGNLGKYYVDLKEGEGQVGEGDVPNKATGFKPEVRITMGEANMLKMFNRELSPATAFMTGKLKLYGDLSKALALETVLKDAREAAQRKE